MLSLFFPAYNSNIHRKNGKIRQKTKTAHKSYLYQTILSNYKEYRTKNQQKKTQLKQLQPCRAPRKKSFLRIVVRTRKAEAIHLNMSFFSDAKQIHSLAIPRLYMRKIHIRIYIQIQERRVRKKMTEKYSLLQDIMQGDYGEEVKAAVEKMTEKQKMFCMEYTQDMNATQAAIRAGYSEKTAYSQGHDLLKKPEIKAVIDAILAKRAKDIELDEDWCLRRFKEISDRCMQKEAVMEFDGEEWVESGVWKFDSTGANRATENIAKILGMFIDRKEIKDVTPGRELSIEDMKRLMQLIEAEKAQK